MYALRYKIEGIEQVIRKMKLRIFVYFMKILCFLRKSMFSY